MACPLVVTGGYDYQLVYWNALTASVLGAVAHSGSQVNCLALAPLRQLVTAGGSSTICAFDLTRYGCGVEPLFSCKGHTGNVTVVGYEASERFLYSGSEDTTAKIWDVKGGSGFQLNVKLEDPIYAACLHPERALCYLGDHMGAVRCWDLVANRLSDTYYLPTGSPIKSLSISANGQLLLAASLDGVVTIFRCMSQTEQQPPERRIVMPLSSFVPHDEQYVPCVKFASANCTFATVSGSGEAALWKAEPMAASPNAKGTDEEEPFKHSEVYATFFLMCNTSADARISDVSAKTKPSDAGLYALPEYNTVYQIKRQTEFRGHNRWAWDCVFSADDRYVLTASDDSTARLWNTQTGQEAVRFAGHHTKKKMTCVNYVSNYQPITSAILVDSLALEPQDFPIKTLS